MFEAIPTPIQENYDSIYSYVRHSQCHLEPETFKDIEKHWHIPDIIYSEKVHQYKNQYDDDPSLPPPPPMSIKRSITVEYESSKTLPTVENPDGIQFWRLKSASIGGYYNRISSHTIEMIYTLLNIKILESYKTQPQYWEGVDIKEYLYRTKQPIQ